MRGKTAEPFLLKALFIGLGVLAIAVFVMAALVSAAH